MKKVTTLSVLAAALLTAPLVQANVCDMKKALGDARSHLVAMVGSTDKSVHDASYEQVQEASGRLNAAIDAAAGSASGDAAAQLTTFKETWQAFVKTREEEIVPAVRAGDNAKAKGIATGVQAGRMKTMNGAIQALGGDSCQ